MKIHNNFRISTPGITLLFLMMVVSLATGSSAKQPTALSAEASNNRDVTTTTAESVESKPEVLFDDFSYANQKELRKHGWIVRTVAWLARRARRNLVSARRLISERPERASQPHLADDIVY